VAQVKGNVNPTNKALRRQLTIFDLLRGPKPGAGEYFRSTHVESETVNWKPAECVDCVDSGNSESPVKTNAVESHGDSLTQASDIPQSTQTTRNTGTPISVYDFTWVDRKYSPAPDAPDEVVVKDKNVGTKVSVRIEQIGEKAKAKYDKVFVTPVLKLTFKYNDKSWECTTDVTPIEDELMMTGCNEALSQLADATNRHPSTLEVIKAINEHISKRFTFRAEPLVEYVRRKYPNELNEIERDPFSWILDRTRDVIGYERLKLLTFLAVVSSVLKRVKGISRVHLNILGQSGAGKSTVVKSVLAYVDESVKIDATRFTEKALGYLDIDTFDGKIVFLEQIDKQNVQYLREAMSEEKICTYVTVKVSTRTSETFKTVKKCIEGQPVFVTTSVADDVNLEKEQVANRMVHAYLKYTYNREVIRTILRRTENEVSEVDKLVFMAYLLTRPKTADVSALEEHIIAFTDKLAELTRSPVNRTAETIRNLIRTVAVARGKTVADMDDYNFVMRHFQLDILFNGLGLTERDVEFIEVLEVTGGLKSDEIADRLKYTKQYVINVLRNLERKGLVEGVKEDGKTFTWYLTSLGSRIKALINELEEGPENNEKDSKAVDPEVERVLKEVNENEALMWEFIEYIKNNDGAVRSFSDIIRHFRDKEKVEKFLIWCLHFNYCTPAKISDNQTAINQFEIHANFEPRRDRKESGI